MSRMTNVYVVDMKDLTLIHNGRSYVLLSAAELADNTVDAILQTGFLVERINDALRYLGVLKDGEA